MPDRPALSVLAACILAAACSSDDSPAPPEPEPPPDAAPASVRLYDTGSGLEITPSATLVSGSTVRVAAHFFDSLGAPKPLETGEGASLSLASAAFGAVTPVPGFPTLWDLTVSGLVDAASALTVGFDGDDVDEDATFGPFAVTAGEGEQGPISISFRGAVDTGRFRCDSTYTVGTPVTGGVRTKDFRFYVHAVRVLTATGREVPVTIPDDGTWQQGGTALIDFEDATGMCAATGTAATRDVVVGTVPAGHYDGLAFVMGVPFGQNHLNVATAAAPFDLTEMFWSWNEGYKFLRADVDAPTIGGFRLHLGSTGCNGANDNTPPSDCTTPNRVDVRLAGFDPRLGHVVADLGAMLATTHVNSNTDPTPPGCTSFDDDPDCAGMFAQLGLPFMGAPAGTQQMFRVGAP